MQWNDIQGLMLMASLPMLVCLQWTVVLLVDWLQERKAVQWRMLAFMATATLLYTCHYVYFTHLEPLLPMANIVYRVCNLLVYPLYLLYIGQLTQGGLGARATWLWLMPALAGGGLYALAFISGSEEWTALASMLCRSLFALLVVGVCWQGLRMLQQFRWKVENFYADTEGRTLRPITVLLVVLTVVSAASFVANAIGRDNIPPTGWKLAVPSVLFSALLFCIGYIGHRPLFSYADAKEDAAGSMDEEGENVENGKEELKEQGRLAAAVAEKEESMTPQGRLEEMAQLIDHVVMQEQLFLKHDLHIIDVARQLGTNDKYVSKAINHVMNQSFSEYINDKRVTYAQELQKKNPELPASDIANGAGFKSMSSYYRHMRRVQQ